MKAQAEKTNMEIITFLSGRELLRKCIPENIMNKKNTGAEYDKGCSKENAEAKADKNAHTISHFKTESLKKLNL